MPHARALAALVCAALLTAMLAAPTPAAAPTDDPFAPFRGDPVTRTAPGRAAPTLPTTREMMRTVKDLVRMAPRATGTPGGRRAARYVADRFRAAGLSDVHFEKVTSYSWRPRDFALEVGGRRIPAYPVSHSLLKGASEPGRTTLGPRGLTAPVVDIGAGPVALHDVRGKYVLFDLEFQLPLAGLIPFMEFLWDPDLELIDVETLLTANPYLTSQQSVVQAAMDGGAVGVIGVLGDYFDSNRYHNEYYRRLEMRIPGMWVTKDDGARLRRRLAGTGEATMRLTVDRREVVARTVVGFLPGRTTDTLMVQSHHDSQGPGAVEDGTGTAEVIALAEHYGALARRPGYRPREKTLMFATFDTHFTGYQSHLAFVEKYVTQARTPYRLVGNVTIEHIGRKAVVGPGGELVTLDQTEPRGFFENLSVPLKLELMRIMARHDLGASAMLNATPVQPIGIPTDASFLLVAGVPIVSLISGPLYMYDEADTIDKVDRGQLRPVLRAFQELIDAMEATPGDLIGLLPPPLAGLVPGLSG